WMELAELVQDNDFRAAVRRMAEYQAAERARGDQTGLHGELTEFVRASVAGALDAGIEPESPEAAAVTDAITARYAVVFDRRDDAELRRWLTERLDMANDPRTERYWSLLALVNGWPVPASLGPVFEWLIAALRAHPAAP
ncbi:MAG TPA: hypothetical protein VFP22_03470, partial [Candidatus Limnocylindrales bacterium]|nr:hypothetical protein [Candidatus Limnocylindrales bacterium]